MALRDTIWRACVLAGGLLVASSAGALSPEPEQVAQRVAQLCSGQPHLLVRSAGKSPRGRDIPMVIASQTPNDLASQTRLLVLARQHGDEPVPAQSALLWLADQGRQARAFGRVAVIQGIRDARSYA